MLTGSDARLMALQQSVQAAKINLADVISDIEDVMADMWLPSQATQQDRLYQVVLALKHIHDFILRSHMP